MRAPTGCISSSQSECTSESEEEGERDLGRARPSASVSGARTPRVVLFAFSMTVARRLGGARATSPDHFKWCLGPF